MNIRITSCVTCACLLGTLATVALAQTPAPNVYVVHNLVSDLPGIADKQDANLVNPWGNALVPDRSGLRITAQAPPLFMTAPGRRRP